MNTTDLLATAARLHQLDQPYALVSVLRVQAPASARPGDKAIVTADGIAHGWIGGGCAQPVVQRAVRQALADGRARMIRIAPADEGSLRELDDVLEFGMACHSGGTLELFVDPMLPRARLTVIGDSPLAAALCALAPRVGLPVTVVAHGAQPERFADAERVLSDDSAAHGLPAGGFAVVATQGRRDLQGLRAALALRAHTVFFVASARKAAVLKAALIEAGDDAAAVNAIVAPAGQAIGAQTPEEIALSVLVAVVAARRAQPAPTPTTPALSAAPEAAAAHTPQAPRTPASQAAPVLSALSAPAAGSCCGGSAKKASAASATPASTTTAAAPTEAPSGADGATLQFVRGV